MLPSVVMSLGSNFYIIYYIVTWYDSTVLHCLAEYVATDDCNIRFGMIAQYDTA